MRGQVDPQGGLFSYFSVEERIPTDHPLRRVKAQADAVVIGSRIIQEMEAAGPDMAVSQAAQWLRGIRQGIDQLARRTS